MDFVKEYKHYKSRFDGYLSRIMTDLTSPSDLLLAAIKYALAGGGKRLRPVLFLAINDFFFKARLSDDDVCYAACAIEALHAYTLVHDDLPCMDNDDFRRGMPSCHKKFGQAIALLAGDSLLNLSYQLLLKAAQINPSIIAGATEFSMLVGAGGLIGGQADEMYLEDVLKFSTNANYNGDKLFDAAIEKTNFENAAMGSASSNLKNQAEKTADLDLKARLLDICKNKTAALFVSAAVLGGVSAGCDEWQLNQLRIFAENFGFAFQLKDDLCDMDGKSFAGVFGVEKTKKLIADYCEKARMAACELNSHFLEKFIDFDKYL